MTNKDNVATVLKTAYVSELETISNYLANAAALDGVHGEYIAEKLSEDIDEELSHARKLANRLEELGEVPPGSMELYFTQDELQPRDKPHTNVEEVIEGVISAEQSAINTYTELATTAEKHDDRVTRHLAEELLADEESHLDEFESLLEEYN